MHFGSTLSGPPRRPGYGPRSRPGRRVARVLASDMGIESTLCTRSLRACPHGRPLFRHRLHPPWRDPLVPDSTVAEVVRISQARRFLYLTSSTLSPRYSETKT